MLGQSLLPLRPLATLITGAGIVHSNTVPGNDGFRILTQHLDMQPNILIVLPRKRVFGSPILYIIHLDCCDCGSDLLVIDLIQIIGWIPLL